MKTNQDGIDIIRLFEGFRSEPYLCPGGYWTIGYGSTRDPSGSRITKDTLPIDEETAIIWMMNDLIPTERSVKALVNVVVNNNQFSSLSSLVYNIGSGNFRASTLRMKLNRGDYDGAINEFKRWNKSGGKILRGLILRRTVEKKLFIK